MSDTSNVRVSPTTDDSLMADVPPTADGSDSTASDATATSSGTATPSGTNPTSDSRPGPSANPDSGTGPDNQPSSNAAWRMLHPAALIVGLAETIKGVVGLFLGLLIIMREHLSPLVIVLIIIGVTLVALSQPAVAWFTTRYRLGNDALSFKSGLFFRKNRTISYGSIHAINSAAPVYLQPFDVVRLTVSAAGAMDTDIRLDAVPAALQLELERLRAAARESSPAALSEASPAASPATSAASPEAIADSGIVTERYSTAASEPTPAITMHGDTAAPASSCRASVQTASAQSPVFRASVRDIVLYSVTDIGFIAAAFVVYGFVQNVQDVLPRKLMHDAMDSFDAMLASGVTAILLLILACVILLMLVSIVTSLLRFYGFEVWRRGDDLVVVRGLFTRHTTTIPVSRIQTVAVRQSLLRRPFHLCSVGLGLSSSVNSANEESGISAARILPVISTRRVYQVLQAMLPEWDVPQLPSEARSIHNPGSAPLRYTGRDLLRYYLTMPIAATVGATALVWLGSEAGPFVGLELGEIPGPGPELGWPWWIAVVPAAAGLYWIATRWLKSRTEGYAILTGMPMNHRIMVTGSIRSTTYLMVTRRARVQSITRSTALWREPRGIERVQMSLFVMNGINTLQFMFMHRPDADVLAGWLEDRR